MPDNDFGNLEQALVRAGRAVVYPATPALADRVRARLESRPESNAFPLGRRVVLALAALAVAIALLLAFPETRDALAQILGLRTIRILPATPTPTLPISPTAALGALLIPTLTPSPASTRTQCCETTLADALARAKFKALLPPSETPARVYLQDLPYFGGVQQLILIFGDSDAPRATLYEANGLLYGKVVNAGTVIEETQVKGQRALWLSGAPHALVYLDAAGQPLFEYERNVTGNTLAWEMGNVTFRLETPMSKEQAIAFAESLR